ncbi:LytR/AlgR family response regulator transcription factor [Spirosoma soli]|uniref:LytR/AlgR family response regulator transcription factor n=1 Tax=Spirosoma soli TaxID=1770529 RepID=A0ABW5MAE1_9BACT
MLSCVIIDDEEHAVDLLKMYVSRTPYLTLLYATTDPVEGLSAITQQQPDLVFLDIHMDDLSGLQIARMLSPKTNIIFTTAYQDFAVEAFEVGVLDYLLKPISFERFLKGTQKALNNAIQPAEQRTEDNEIFVKVDNKSKMVKIGYDEIVYIEGLKNYVSFHLQTNSVIVLLTFKELEERLPANQFMRMHKSYIINVNKISGIDGNEVITRTDKKEVRIPIGNTYRNKIFQSIRQKMLGGSSK